MKKLVLVLFCILLFSHSIAQNVSIDTTFFDGICSGKRFQVPVTLSNHFNPSSSFSIKLERVYLADDERDTTIVVQALNNTSPLIFELPKIFSLKKEDRQNYRLTLESQNPASSVIIPFVLLKTLPSIELGYSIEKDSLKNEYWSSTERPKLLVKLLNSNNTNSKIYSNGNQSPFFAYNGQRELVIPPLSQKITIFKIDSVVNDCGKGRIEGLNEVVLKKNDFPIRIVNILPKTICEDKNVNIWIDYDGEFERNNLFFVDIADNYGNVIISVQVEEDSDKHFLFESNNLPSGYYKVRIRATYPECATKFFHISVKPKPTITFQWLTDLSNPIGYLNPISLRLKYTNELNEGDVGLDRSYAPLSITLSNGFEVSNFSSFTGFENGYFKDIQNFRMSHSQFITVDSINSTCGQITDYTAIGDKFISVNNSFFIKKLEKLDYCIGESVVLSIETSFSLNSSSRIKVELYNNSISLQVNAILIGYDKLTFTIPPGFEHGAELNFQVTCSDPNFQSAPYHNKLRIKKKLELALQDPMGDYSLQSPSVGIMSLVAKGVKPDSIFYTQNGIKKSTPFLGLEYPSSYNSHFLFNIGQTSNFIISQTENECGVFDIIPPLSFTFSVLSQEPKAIFLNTDEIVLLPDSQFVISFDTTGLFSPSDVFVANISTYFNGQFQQFEVARGRFLKLVGRLPSGIINSYNLTLTISSELTESQNLELTTRSNIVNIRNLGLPYFSSIDYEFEDYYGPENNLIKNKKFNGLVGKNYRIRIASDREIDELLINSEWRKLEIDNRETIGSLKFSYLNFSLERDTTLLISKFKTELGEGECRDSIQIFSKNNRIRFSMIKDLYEIPIICQGTYIDLNYTIDGNSNYQDEFEVYFVPRNRGFVTMDKFKAEIIKKSNNFIRVKVPVMPWEHDFKIEMESSNEKNKFAEYNNFIHVIIGKKHEVFLSAIDGSDYAWSRGYYSDNQRPYVTTLNSNNPYWTGNLYSTESNFSTIETIDNSFEKLSVSVPFEEVIQIKNIESTCGYGKVTGTFKLRKCDQSLYLNSFTPKKGEFYSSDFIISSEIPHYENQLYSAKNFILLQPGFESKNTNFKAVIEGCTTD